MIFFNPVVISPPQRFIFWDATSDTNYFYTMFLVNSPIRLAAGCHLSPLAVLSTSENHRMAPVTKKLQEVHCPSKQKR